MTTVPVTLDAESLSRPACDILPDEARHSIADLCQKTDSLPANHIEGDVVFVRATANPVHETPKWYTVWFKRELDGVFRASKAYSIEQRDVAHGV